MELSDNIKPIHYDLYFNIDIQNLILNGETIIEIEILRKIDCIILNSKKLNIIELFVDNKRYDFTIDDKNEIIVINGFFTKDRHNIMIKYNCEIGIDMDGIYYTKIDNSIIISTQLEPIYARKVFPCFDAPQLKSTYSIKIKSSKNKTFLSNMPIKTTELLGENKIIEFNKTPKMSSYLVCIVVGDLKKGIPCKIRDNLIVNGFYFDKSINQLNNSIKTTASSVKYFEKLFDIEYKLPKLDIVAIPNFLSGAMENWGLITFRETGLMTDNIQNIGSLISNIEVIYHEISHQWFGNLVTLNSWKDIWLNEATATYFSWLGLFDNYTHLQPKQWYYISTFRGAILADGFNSTHPISTEITTTTDVLQFFDDISYSKGSCLINYLSNFMGREYFMKGINEYLKRYSWKTAKPENLYSILEDYNKNKTTSISDLVKKFILVKGFPILSVFKKDDKYIITKKRFLFIKDDTNSNFPIDFPLNINIFKNGKLEKITIEIKDSVIIDYEPILNKDNMLLSIVNYDNFNPKIRFMKIIELMHYYDSMYFLVISGYKEYKYFFNLVVEIFDTIDFLQNLETSLCLFILIIKNLMSIHYIIKSIEIKNSLFDEFNKLIENIKPYIIRILKDIIHKQKNMKTYNWFLNLVEFLLDLQDNHIIKMTKKLYDTNIKNNEITNFNDLPLYELLKYYVKYNDTIETREQITKIKTLTTNIFVKNQAIYSLTYSQDEIFLQYLMDNIFDIVKLQDIGIFIFHLSRNVKIQEKVIDWIFKVLKNNKNITYQNFANVIEKITPNIFNLKILNKLKKFYINEKDTSTYALEIDKIDWNISIIQNIMNYK
jgi:aminopeptidase N